MSRNLRLRLSVNLAAVGCLAGSCTESVATFPDVPAREEPVRLHRVQKGLVDCSVPVWQDIIDRFRPRLRTTDAGADGSPEKGFVVTPSLCVHCLRVHGLRKNFEDEILSSGATVVQALTDNTLAKSVFGAEVLVATRYGARFRPPGELPEMQTQADSAHLDQNLSALLELGVPLSTPLGVCDADLTLADVLADTIANFNLHEIELEWTSVAIALALPPIRAWRNRYGEVYSFDDVAERLTKKQFEFVSCGGTHVLYAMVVLATVHAQYNILSSNGETELNTRIRQLLDLVARNQHSDGSWDHSWFREIEDPARPKKVRTDLTGRILVTGHIGECLLLLPETLRVDDEVLRKSGDWLHRKLPGYIRTARMSVEFCPLTHAAVVLGALRRHT